MAKFKIKWKSGVEETVEQSDCETVEQYVNTRFGRGADLKEFGVTVSLAGEATKHETKPQEEYEKPEDPEVPPEPEQPLEQGTVPESEAKPRPAAKPTPHTKK